MSKKDQILDDELPQEPDAGPSSFFPETGPGLAKEVKIGLAVLLGLLTVFGAVVVKKMRRPADPPAVAEDNGAKPEQAGDKLSPKVPPPGAPGTKPSESPFSAGKSGSISLSGNAPKWNAPADIHRPKEPASDSRFGSAPPSPMPRSGGFASGPSSDSSTRPGGLEKAGPPSPRFNDEVNRSSPRSSDATFDPLPKQPSSPGFSNSPSMVQGSSGPGSSSLSSGNDGRLGPERHPRHGGSFAASTTTLPSRDITDLSAPTPRTMTAPAGAAASAVADPRLGSSRASLPDNTLPPTTSTFGAPAAGGFRSSADSFTASSRLGAGAPASFGRADLPPGPRSFGGSSGQRPDGTYQVQPSDNYSSISKQLYGTDAYYRALAEHNRNRFPDENHLRVGDVVSTPSAAELQRNYPSLCPKPGNLQAAPDQSLISNVSVRGSGGPRVYVVQEGDNLFNIAKYELHNATRWVEIYELNRDLLGSQVDRLKPGMRLALPNGAAPTPRTASQDSGLRR